MKTRNLLAITALGAWLGFTGCSSASQTAQASGHATGDASLAPDVEMVGNHGATGVEGGVGPSLHNEHERKNDDATIAWIENPAPPMPKLYPSVLTQAEVLDVAAYVQSL